jgi:hypothetical protein
MRKAAMTIGCLLAILAAPVGAQEEEERYDVVAALKKVAELMGETEAHLVNSLSGRSPEEAAEAGERTREEIEKLLRKSESSSQAAVDKMTEILEKAPRTGGAGGGGGQDQESPDSEEERRRREEEQNAQDRDPKNSSEGNKEPNSPEDSKSEPEGETAKPPPSDTDDPSMPNPEDDWLGRLPDKLRQAVLNGEYDKLPPKFRKLLERYLKRLAEVESDR